MALLSRSPLERKRAGMVRNLVKLYKTADHTSRADGRNWYDKARLTVLDYSNVSGLSVPTVACVIGAVSPQCDWGNNLRIAFEVIQGLPITYSGGGLPTNIAKAQRIVANYPHASLNDVSFVMREFFPYGPKVNAFARNLAGDDSIVTIDSHAYEAARNDCTITQSLNDNRYRIVAECYTRAATIVNESLPVFQAICWLEWKRRYPRTEKRVRRSRVTHV